MHFDPILIVDDDPDDREFIKEGFRLTGYKHTLLEFNNASEFVAFINAKEPGQKPRLVIIDHNLPPFTAHDILKEISARRKESYFPVIVFSTALSPQAKEDILKVGASCVIAKPGNTAELTKIISSVCLLWCPD